MPQEVISVNGQNYTVSTEAIAGGVGAILGFSCQGISHAVATAAMNLGNVYVGNPNGENNWVMNLIGQNQLYVYNGSIAPAVANVPPPPPAVVPIPPPAPQPPPPPLAQQVAAASRCCTIL